MVTVDWDCDRTDGVTFVRAYVTAEHPHRVRVENCLDGPVWPPRRRGQVAAGWDDGGFEGVVTPTDRLVAGYATAARPADPPVELAWADPVSAGDLAADGESGTGADDPASPAAVVRSLGDPTVPRDAVPVPDEPRPTDGSKPTAGVDSATDHGADCSTGPTDGRQSRVPDDTHPPADRDCDLSARPRDANGSPGERPEEASRVTDAGAPSRDRPDAALLIPRPVRDWLADVRRRAGAADRSSDGGPLSAAVAADRRALARLGRRVEALQTRLDGEDPPTDRREAATER